MQDLTFNKKEILSRIKNGDNVHVQFKYINEEILMMLNSIVANLLERKDHIFLLNSLITILREIVINALKANAKRIFFLKKELNIQDASDYTKGMLLFKKEIIGDFEIISSDLNRSDFFVALKFESSDNSIIITVSNNSAILPEELERINYRIKKAIQYNDFSEAYAEIEDDSEGAGLGIVLTMLLLKNMGIDPMNYQISADNRITTTILTVPDELRSTEITSIIKNQILSDIDGIPTFPQHIIELQRLCNDPDSSINLIMQRLATDPALSSDVIKLSNSAGISPGKRIEDLKTAIVTIGLKNLNGILTASNARRILNERYSSYEQIWDHCNKVAFYARNIALSFRLSKTVENSYMAGLLHDLGKIVLLATDMVLVNRIADIVKNRKISTTTIMEEISIGISHSNIGAMIANKWHFPDYLIQAIKYHHSPLNCDGKYSDIVSTVYLANMMTGIEERKYNFYYIEESILERFNLRDYERFQIFHEGIKNKFETFRTY